MDDPNDIARSIMAAGLCARTRDLAPPRAAAAAVAEPPLPSVVQMLANAGRAIARGCARAAAGKPVRVAPQQEAARLAVCDGCQYFRRSDGRCSECGCKLAGALLRKAALATEDCPRGLWPKQPTQEGKHGQ